MRIRNFAVENDVGNCTECWVLSKNCQIRGLNSLTVPSNATFVVVII